MINIKMIYSTHPEDLFVLMLRNKMHTNNGKWLKTWVMRKESSSTKFKVVRLSFSLAQCWWILDLIRRFNCWCSVHVKVSSNQRSSLLCRQSTKPTKSPKGSGITVTAGYCLKRLIKCMGSLSDRQDPQEPIPMCRNPRIKRRKNITSSVSGYVWDVLY